MALLRTKDNSLRNRSCQNSASVDNPHPSAQSLPLIFPTLKQSDYPGTGRRALCGVPNANLKLPLKRDRTVSVCIVPRADRRFLRVPIGPDRLRPHPVETLDQTRQHQVRIRTNCWLAGLATRCSIRMGRSFPLREEKNRHQPSLPRLRRPQLIRQPRSGLIRRLPRAGAKSPPLILRRLLIRHVPPGHRNSRNETCRPGTTPMLRHACRGRISIRHGCGGQSRRSMGLPGLGRRSLI